jgi:HK97 family phage portal protein
VSATTNNDDIATSYHINTGQFRGSYQREELIDGRVVYINKVSMAQLWIMKKFNPDQGSNSSRGLSPLASVFYEIESHLGISKHNNGTLRNGARPSGAAIVDRPPDTTGPVMEPDQIQIMKEQMQEFYSGANNSGNVMILDGIKEFIELSKSNKDMDFLAFLEGVKDQIYNNLRIPLPLKNSDSMTFSNFQEAKDMLFDINTIPFSISYAEEINRFLMPRFDDSGRYRYVVDIERIPALERRKLEKLIEFKEDLTPNERREIIGFKEIDGGNKLLPPKTVIAPIPSKSRDEFVDNLRDYGKFTEEVIQTKADAIYGSHCSH